MTKCAVVQPITLQHVSGHICHICEDDVGINIDGEVFVACDECAFPICKTCYEYERSEGSQVCPQCKTRLKRLKGISIFFSPFSLHIHNTTVFVCVGVCALHAQWKYTTHTKVEIE